MKLLILAISVAFISQLPLSEIKAQSDEVPALPRYAIHVDAGILGYAGTFTVNFEARLWKNKHGMFWLRSGYGYFGAGTLGSSRSIYGMPVNLTALYGKKTHFLELTIGGIFGLENETIDNQKYPVSFGVWPLVDVGYRLQLSPRGIILRVKIGTGGIGGGIGFGF